MLTFCFVNYHLTTEYEVPSLGWLSFKAYYEQNSQHTVNWPLPITSSNAENAEVLADRILSHSPDIVGFSLYVWNAGLTHHVAEIVKQKSPATLIVFGGPDLHYESDPDYFKNCWYIDIACDLNGYGEPFILDLLDQLNENRYDPESITCSIYPSEDRTTYHKSKAKFDKRAWKWPRKIFENGHDYIAAIKDKPVLGIYESSRGCPFGCVYCEWGGGINSKVNFKPVEYVLEDLEYMLNNLNITMLTFSDANFGISEHYHEIVDYIVDYHKRTNTLKVVNFTGPTKTNKKNIYKMYDKLMSVGLYKNLAKLSLQDFDPLVLQNIKRTDDPWEKQEADMLALLNKHNLDPNNIEYELILGLPGANLDVFYDSLDIAGTYKTYRHIWHILPTSPAAKPSYIKQFDIKTIKTKQTLPYDYSEIVDNSVLFTETSGDLINSTLYQRPTDIVVGTHSYTPDDWIEMMIVGELFASFKNSGILKAPLMYIKDYTSLKVSQFVRDFYREFLYGNKLHPVQQNILNKIQTEMQRKVKHDECADNIEFVSLTGVVPFDISAKISSAFLLAVFIHPEGFFEALEKWVDEKYNDPILTDSIAWTSQAIMTLDYNPELGKEINSRYDWYSLVIKYQTIDLTPGIFKWRAFDTNWYSAVEDPTPIEWYKYSMLDKVKKFLLPFCSNHRGLKLHIECEVIDD